MPQEVDLLLDAMETEADCSNDLVVEAALAKLGVVTREDEILLRRKLRVRLEDRAPLCEAFKVGS